MGVEMAITRLNHFEAKAGRGADLRRFLSGVIGIVRGCAGCVSCELLESVDHPDRLVIVEVWESVEAHQAAARAIPPGMLKQAVTLFGAPVTGAYYRSVID
jgi:quinol monooxygenase YgiN